MFCDVDSPFSETFFNRYLKNGNLFLNTFVAQNQEFLLIQKDRPLKFGANRYLCLSIALIPDTEVSDTLIEGCVPFSFSNIKVNVLFHILSENRPEEFHVSCNETMSSY